MSGTLGHIKEFVAKIINPIFVICIVQKTGRACFREMVSEKFLILELFLLSPKGTPMLASET